MNQLVRENLELAERDGVSIFQCAHCKHRLAGANEDWHQACVVKRLPPERMGPHRELLRGRFDLQEHYCPRCGVTLDATVVEVKINPAEGRRPARREGGQSVSPQPVALQASSTAIVILDLHVKAVQPGHVAYALVDSVPGFLARARASLVPVAYIVPAWDQGSPEELIAPSMRRQSEEPVFYPKAYDKFAGGELQKQLESWGTRTLIFLGGSANFSLLYTAPTAARTYGYSVVLPVDGLYAHSDYEMDYALYQFTVLPRIQDKFRFTTLAGIEFH